MEREIEEVENTVPDVGALASTSDLNINIGEVEDKEPSHDKNVTASEFNEFSERIFDQQLNQILIPFRNVLVKMRKKKEKSQTSDLS